MQILISSGEASGEFYGAELMKALRQRLPGEALRFFGVGGDRMRAEGCELLADAKELAEVGIVEVVERIPHIYRRFREVVRETRPPPSRRRGDDRLPRL